MYLNKHFEKQSFFCLRFRFFFSFYLIYLVVSRCPSPLNSFLVTTHTPLSFFVLPFPSFFSFPFSPSLSSTRIPLSFSYFLYSPLPPCLTTVYISLPFVTHKKQTTTHKKLYNGNRPDRLSKRDISLNPNRRRPPSPQEASHRRPRLRQRRHQLKNRPRRRRLFSHPPSSSHRWFCIQ